MGLALCAVISDPLAPQGPAVARGGTGSDQASKRQNPKQCCGLRFWSMFTTGKHFKVQKLHRRTQNPQTCAQLNLLHVQEKSPLREQLNYCAVCSRWPAQNSRSPWDASEFRKKNWKEDRQNINKTCKPVWRILKDFEGNHTWETCLEGRRRRGKWQSWWSYRCRRCWGEKVFCWLWEGWPCHCPFALSKLYAEIRDFGEQGPSLFWVARLPPVRALAFSTWLLYDMWLWCKPLDYSPPHSSTVHALQYSPTSLSLKLHGSVHKQDKQVLMLLWSESLFGLVLQKIALCSLLPARRPKRGQLSRHSLFQNPKGPERPTCPQQSV